jgi:hypothetical protein
MPFCAIDRCLPCFISLFFIFRFCHYFYCRHYAIISLFRRHFIIFIFISFLLIFIRIFMIFHFFISSIYCHY